MMENIIAIGVGVVVGGGILTLVWRILTGDREQKKIDEALSRFVPDDNEGKQDKQDKKDKKDKR